jgi:hypothetical protein
MGSSEPVMESLFSAYRRFSWSDTLTSRQNKSAHECLSFVVGEKDRLAGYFQTAPFAGEIAKILQNQRI